MAGEYVLSIQMRAQNQAAAAMASVRQGFAQIAVAQQRVKLTTDQAKLSYDRYIQVMTNAKATQQQVQIAADQVAVALDRVKVAQGNVTTATERTRRAELQATTAMREEGTAARSTGMSLMDLASKASMVIMGLQQVAQIAVQVAQAIIEPNAAFEQMTVAMKTLLPVGNQAADMLNKLWAFAAKTPFQFQDIDLAAQKMLAFRFKAQSVIPTLTAIGDALSAVSPARYRCLAYARWSNASHRPRVASDGEEGPYSCGCGYIKATSRYGSHVRRRYGEAVEDLQWVNDHHQG